jgi:ribosome-binding protein aMBF1 (putative translation factor)
VIDLITNYQERLRRAIEALRGVYSLLDRTAEGDPMPDDEATQILEAMTQVLLDERVIARREEGQAE